MRILNVVFEDRIGGPTRRIVRVGSRLLEYGVDTVLCLPDGSGNAADFARESGVEVRRIRFERIPRPSDLRRVLRWMALTPRDIWRFAELFRREDADIVHVNGAFFIAPGIAAKLLGIPIVWHLNDTIVPRRVAPVFGNFVRVVATRIVAAAEAVAQHYGVSTVAHEVIYAPVDLAQFDEVAREGVRGEMRVGLLANRLPTKGVEYFIEAAGLIRKRRQEARFVIAGAKFPNHADYYERTQQMVAELGLGSVLRDYGFVSSVEDVLGELDVLVLSSPTMEASPTVILEAMAAGLPVVAADVGGVREILLRDPARPAGVVVPTRSSEGIAEAVLELLDDPERAASMGRNGRRLAGEYFSLERCTSKHLEVYVSMTKAEANAYVGLEERRKDA